MYCVGAALTCDDLEEPGDLVPVATVFSDWLALIPFVDAEVGVVRVSSHAFAVVVLLGATAVTSPFGKV